MDTVNLGYLSLITGGSETLIAYYFIMFLPYLKATMIAAGFLVEGAALLYMGWIMLQSMIRPSQFAENTLRAVVLITFLFISLMPVTMTTKEIVGNDAEYNDTFEMPFLVYTAWKSIMTGYRLIMESVDSISQLPPQGLVTSAVIQANKEGFGEKWDDGMRSYSDFTQHCSIDGQKIRSIAIQKGLDFESYKETDLHSVGLNGGNGIFLTGIVGEEGGLIDAEEGLLWEHNDTDTWYESVSKSVLNGRTNIVNASDRMYYGAKSLLDMTAILKDSPETAADSARLSQLGAVERSRDILTFPAITTKLKDRYRIQKTPGAGEGGEEVQPEYLTQAPGLDQVMWEGSETRAALVSQIQARGGDVNAEMVIEDDRYEGYFHPENCYEMYLIVKSQIQAIQAHLGQSGYRISDAAVTSEIGTVLQETGPIVSAAASHALVQAYSEKQKGNNFTSHDSDAFDLRSQVREGAYVLAEGSNMIKGFDAETTLPYIIATLSAGAAFLIILFPLMIAISPMIGGGALIARMIQLLLVVYLTLFIYHISFEVCNAVKDVLFDRARISLSGPGSIPAEIMQMTMTVNYIAIMLAGTISITLAYLIVMGDSSGLRKAAQESGAAIGGLVGGAIGYMLGAGKGLANSFGGGGDDGGGQSGSYIPSQGGSSTPTRSSGGAVYDMQPIRNTPQLPSGESVSKGFSLRGDGGPKGLPPGRD